MADTDDQAQNGITDPILDELGDVRGRFAELWKCALPAIQARSPSTPSGRHLAADRQPAKGPPADEDDVGQVLLPEGSEETPERITGPHLTEDKRHPGPTA